MFAMCKEILPLSVLQEIFWGGLHGPLVSVSPRDIPPWPRSVNGIARGIFGAENSFQTKINIRDLRHHFSNLSCCAHEHNPQQRATWKRQTTSWLARQSVRVLSHKMLLPVRILSITHGDKSADIATELELKKVTVSHMVLSMKDYIIGNDLIKQAKGKIDSVHQRSIAVLTLEAIEYLAAVLEKLDTSFLSRQDGMYPKFASKIVIKAEYLSFPYGHLPNNPN